MCIGWCDFYSMNQPCSSIHSNMALHSEAPFVALLCLVHLGIALLFRVLGRTRCIDDCRIDDRVAPHDMTGFHHDAVDCFKECLVQIVLLQKPPELEQRRCIRSIFLKEINPHEFAHGIAIVDSVLNAFVRQDEPALKQIHPQHLFNSLRRTAALSARIIRRDIGHPCRR